MLSTAITGLPQAINRQLRKAMEFSLQPVINATGVILHTNLGRAPLAESSLKRVMEVAGRYSNLEFDMIAGERGKRDAPRRAFILTAAQPGWCEPAFARWWSTIAPRQ